MCIHLTLVSWKHTTPDESPPKKRNQEGALATPSVLGCKLYLITSFQQATGATV